MPAPPPPCPAPRRRRRHAAALVVGVRRDPAPRAHVLAGALSLGRLLVGSVALGVRAATRGWVGRPGASGRGLVVIGLLWFGLYNVALNAGERRVDAGTAAMLIQLSPVLVAVLAAMFLKEKATPALGVGPAGRVRRRRADRHVDRATTATATRSACCSAWSRPPRTPSA